MTVEIVTILGGKFAIERRRPITMALGKKVEVKTRTLPQGFDIRVFMPVFIDAFPEMNLSGVDQQPWFVDQGPDGGKEARVKACAKLRSEGFSAREVAEIMLKGNSLFKTELNLDGILKENSQDYTDRLATEIVKYYPGGEKSK